MGSEYMCAKAHGVFAGPANATVVDGMTAWGINAIRLPMNEDCWLGAADLHHTWLERFGGLEWLLSAQCSQMQMCGSRAALVVCVCARLGMRYDAVGSNVGVCPSQVTQSGVPQS
jgi:hypothetical protein